MFAVMSANTLPRFKPIAPASPVSPAPVGKYKMLGTKQVLTMFTFSWFSVY